MPKPVVILDKPFGRWTILHRTDNDPVSREVVVVCRCTCGTERPVRLRNLKNGSSESCGCLHDELFAESLTKHGQARSKTYRMWCGMVARCSNPNNRKYHLYGGKGIKVCERWRDFANFLADMGESPDGLTIEREKGDKGYEPGNCHWATYTEQNRNTSRNRYITYNGVTRCVSEWAELLGIQRNTLDKRLETWSVEKALTTPAPTRRQ